MKRGKSKGKKKTCINRKILRSTQSFLPVKDIREGIILTEDDRYVKIIEFSPINFSLRSAMEQAMIVDDFAAMLKIAPSRIQFKSFSRRADKEKHLLKLQKDYEREENPQCRKLLQEYMQLVENVADSEGITRQFFMVVEYESATRNSDFYYIANNLNTTVNTICSRMRQCGNEVIHHAELADLSADAEQLEILYEANISEQWGDTDPVTLMVYQDIENIPCQKFFHNIITLHKSVPLLNKSTSIKIPVHFCKNCGKSFIGEKTLEYCIQNYGKLNIRIKQAEPQDAVYSKGFSDESQLHSYGYNVVAGGLTTKDRRDILVRLLNQNLMTYEEIRRDLETSIYIFENRESYQAAIDKWRGDLKFITDYYNQL